MKKRNEIILFVLSLLLFLAIGLNVSRFFTRIDLTQNRVFTISKVSRQLFQEIPEQVFITYYVSDKLKSLYTFPMQIEDLLYEYAAYSRGKIKVDALDPIEGGEATRAEALGVYPQQIEVVERDQRSVAQVYTGIVIQYLDRYETIPVVSRIEGLEYELTSKIRRVVTDEERVVGLLIGDAERVPENDFGTLYASLSRNFQVRPVERGEDIPGDIEMLFVLGGKDLDEFDLYPIDQYLMKGGRALFAVKGVQIDFMRGLVGAPLGEDQPVLQMLDRYGVEVGRAFVLDQYCQNFRVPRQLLGQVMWEILGKYPYWITVAGQFASKENPITARFQGLDLYWPSPLELDPPEGVQGEVLLSTTPEAWVQSEPPFETNPMRASMLLAMPREDEQQYPLVVALRGSFPSFFADREIPEREGVPRDWSDPQTSSTDTRILVVGDSDFATELYQYTGASYNMEFLSNAAEWMSSSPDLLEIKTRVARDLRLNKIQDPETRLRSALFTQLFTLVFVPLVVVAFGVTRLVLRRRKSTVRGEEA
ncbi:MAG: GldG family protein [Spirochaetales bacterium]|nr:GldG family protein [Spirochaetales bacterium]